MTTTYGTGRFRSRAGRCYQLAFLAMERTAPVGTVLVHGTVASLRYPAGRIGHAWLELPDGSVWEPVTQQTYTAAAWADVFSPTDASRYTPADARERLLAHGTYGPWSS